MRRQPEGFGIKAHPILRRMCDVIGYKDIHVKQRGSQTALSMINTFLRALHEFETDQERADYNQMNVIEIDPQAMVRSCFVSFREFPSKFFLKPNTARLQATTDLCPENKDA